ncbi:MAG: flavodoxin domain-containing protein [Coriobacteriia bacterium]|nr:flavodoxin domain-containing protein [Coriobacteriia bacterium]MBN2821728.1 flavodoxin domain-containing protein [Coriobacteriia bacterium]
MSSILVVYGTKTGCTTSIAEHIGATLVDAGWVVDVTAAEEKPDPSAYDAVIVGSGVRAGNWHGPVKSWVTTYAQTLKGMPTAFFTTGLTIARGPESADEVRAYTDPLVEATGVQPVDIGLFPGMNDLKKLSLPERLIMKAMKVPEGDFRDMDAVADWTREVVGKLGAE